MIRFYDIDSNYVDYLRSIDKQIPNINYDSNNKFVCGVVFQIGNIKYYAPVSHMNKQQRTNLLIYDGNKPISSIRFSFMLPAFEDVLTEKDFDDILQTDSDYYRLLVKEYDYCKEHEYDILEKARAVYKIGCNKNHKFNYACCDFKLLEQKYKEYKK